MRVLVLVLSDELLFGGCRHFREAKRCLYGSDKVTDKLCEVHDSLRHGQEMALDFICINGYSGKQTGCMSVGEIRM